MRCMFESCPGDALDDSNYCSGHAWTADTTTYQPGGDPPPPGDGGLESVTPGDPPPPGDYEDGDPPPPGLT
jgi:hypothetical protein